MDLEKAEQNKPPKSRTKLVLGCTFLSIYLIMGCFEVVTTYQWLTIKLDWHGLLAAPVGLLIGFTPGLGSLVSYWTATELWGWDSLTTIVVFSGITYP